MTQYIAYIQTKSVYEVCGFKGANRQLIKEENLEKYIESRPAEAQKYKNCYRIVNKDTKEIIYTEII